MELLAEIKSIFGKGPLTEKKIAKVAKLASNPYAQPDVRMREMQRLLQDGSPAALRGLLKRFAANANGAIADEDEKKWLEDTLADLGEPIIEPLREYIRSEKQLTYALRAYRRIVGPEEAVRFDIEVLEHYGPEAYRAGDAKLQIIWELAELLEDERVLQALCPFVLDHSDDVRWAIIDLLERAADADLLPDGVREAACEQLAKLVTDDETGPRIQQRAAEVLANREWQLPPSDAEQLAPSLEDVYFLDKKRYVRRRARSKGSS